MNTKEKFLTTLCLVSATCQAFSQQTFSLDEAVQVALKRNDLIKSSEFRVEYFRQIKRSASEIGKLNAIWMHGQYNSLYQDNNVTLTESIPFPTLLSSQIKLGKEEVIGAEKELRSVQNDLVFDVKSTYYRLLFEKALRDLFQKQDSLFADFARASTARYNTGESNFLEKATAETQWMEIRNQLRLSEADVQISETSLRALLKYETNVTTGDVFSRRDVSGLLDTLVASTNPQLDYLQQQANIGHQARKVESNKLLPDINVGYFNQSLIGVQNINGQDQFFGREKHFQGFQLGVSIPLWFGPTLARSRAAAFQEESLRKTAAHFKTNLGSSYRQALQEFDKNNASLQYYEDQAIKNADLISLQAQKAYHSGAIGYIEYLQALKNVISIQSGYLHAQNAYNQSVIKLEYLSGKF
jgi:cobalt-zinc-cadmium resistance protein CzcA